MNEIRSLLTIRDYLRWAVSRFNEASLFFGHGTDNAWDEAVALILHVLHLPPDIDPKVLDGRLTLTERHTVFDRLQRRIQERTPAPYLTHEAWFAGLSFYVDDRVLIPRSPLAELIESHFQPWIDPDRVRNILDLCTGSGCIAVASAQAFPGATVDATDISNDALAVAKINMLRYSLEHQINLYASDLFEALPHKKYEVIISNPPYVDAFEMAELPPEFQHEPALALAAGKDGLDIVKRILFDAKKYLTPHGILIVEVGNSEHALIEQFPNVPFTWLEFQRGGGGVFLLTHEQL